MTKKCGQQNKSRINKMKQDNEESINISDNVNLKHFYCCYNCWHKPKHIKYRLTSLNLSGTTWNKCVLDRLAVLHLNNRLYT